MNNPNPWSQSGTAPINGPNPSQSGTAPLYQNSPELPGSFGLISETSEVDYFRTPYASYSELPTNNADGKTRDRAGDGENPDMVSGIFSDLEPL